MAPGLSRRPPQVICSSQNLVEQGSYGFRVIYRGEQRDAILIRHGGVAYGYLNRCVHMPKPLDCEHHEVFDETGQFLRCSMHGITYEPATGCCQSEICAGKSLTTLKIVEHNGALLLTDKRGRLVD